jgi:predicted ATPase
MTDSTPTANLVYCPRIVVTGGPGGGKSMLMRELRAEDLYTKRSLLTRWLASVSE